MKFSKIQKLITINNMELAATLLSLAGFMFRIKLCSWLGLFASISFLANVRRRDFELKQVLAIMPMALMGLFMNYFGPNSHLSRWKCIFNTQFATIYLFLIFYAVWEFTFTPQFKLLLRESLWILNLFAVVLMLDFSCEQDCSHSSRK